MQSKLRRVLSVLAVLAMLCTLLPLSAITSVSAAGTNLIVNGDFEAGGVGAIPSGWSAENTSKQYAMATSAQAHNGSYSAVLANRYDSFVLYQDIAVTANTQYTVSFWYKSTNTSSSTGAFKYLFGVYDTADVKANTSGSNGSNDGGTLIDSTATEVELDYHASDWTQIVYTFNSGSATTVRLGFSPIVCNWSNFNADSGTEFMYVDDVVATAVGGGSNETTYETKLEKDWNDGVLGFKTGSVVAEGPDGSNCMKWSATGGWSATSITISGMEQNTDYLVHFKMKTSAGAKLFITMQAYSDGEYGNETFKTTTEWADYEMVINTKTYVNSEGKMRFKFQDTGVAQDVWVDDLYIAKIIAPEGEEEEENLIVNGDFEDTTGTGWKFNAGQHSFSTDAYSGDHALELTDPIGYGEGAIQAVAVKPGKNYTLTWYAKRVSGSGVFNIIVFNTANWRENSTLTGGNNYTNDTSGEWVQYKLNIVNNTFDSITIKFTSQESSSAGTMLIDNVVLTEDPTASYDGYIYDGDFELNDWAANWTNVNNSCTVSLVDGRESKKALSIQTGQYQQVRQLINVEANTDYSLTLWAKNTTNMALMIKTGATDQNYKQKNFSAGSTWTQITYDFNSGDNTSLYVGLMGTVAGAAAIIDDISMVAVKDPSFDGYLYNGDFEAGSLAKWNSHSSTTLSLDAAKNGKYGVIVKGSGNWGGLLDQDFTLEAGKTYKLSFWYKNIATGVNMAIRDHDRKDADGKNDLKLAGNYLNGKSEWTLYETTFKSGYSTNVYLNFSGSGENAGDEMWVDDIKIENLSGDEMDRCEILKNSGTSIRDVDDNNRGLAFRFFVNVNGAQIVNGNQFVSGSGAVKLFEYADTMGTLIEAGAIVTNDAAKGTAGLTMDSVDGGKTVKIAAKYLTDLSETDMGFAVRIVNIPADKVGVQIYARPYYTYDIGGQQVTIYGDTVDENYEHVSSIRRSLKVLAIGNSFSVDAMENYLYDVLKSADYDQVILGNLYIGGCSLDTHWNNIHNDIDAYEFRKNDDNGTWVKTDGYTALNALKEENWDVITIQQASPDSGRPDTYGNLENIVNWIHTYKTNPNAKVMWHMTWAYHPNTTHAQFSNYGKDQMTMYNAIVDAAENTAMKVNGIDGIIPSGTAIQNMRGTALGNNLTGSDGYHLNDTYGDYTAALTWFRAITGETLDLVDFVPESVANHAFNIKRAVGHAVLNPYAITDLSETVLITGSDFQPSSNGEPDWQKGFDNINAILGGIKNTDGYELFDGMLFPGDFTPNHVIEDANEGIAELDRFSNDFVVGNKVYSEGNHDDPTVGMLSPSGNNDPVGGTYGVYVIHEADYGQFGGGKSTELYDDLKAYFDEKVASGWDQKKPIFVMTHVPLHFNWRTVSDHGAGKNAQYIVDALNYGGEAGFNIIFLFGHNHSSDYDAYLGGASIYLAKGDTMLIAKPDNYKEYQEVELKFTYLNSGYVAYYLPNDRAELDCTLTMTTFKIQADGSVIITRYDADGYHNLKAKGVAHNPNQHNVTIPVNEDVYGPQRIVTATSDEEYTGE